MWSTFRKGTWRRNTEKPVLLCKLNLHLIRNNVMLNKMIIDENCELPFDQNEKCLLRGRQHLIDDSLKSNWNQVLLGPICFKVNLECLKMLTTKRTTVELKLDRCLSESRNLLHFAEHSMIQIRLLNVQFYVKVD